MSGTARQVIAYTPDGSEVTWKTAAGWTVAGLVKKNDLWISPLAGHSDTSVTSRARTWASKWGGSETAVAAIWDCTAPAIAEYFDHHQVVITQTFTPGTNGWTILKAPQRAGRAVIRRLNREGVTAISVRSRRSLDWRLDADFQMTELLDSMKTRKA